MPAPKLLPPAPAALRALALALTLGGATLAGPLPALAQAIAFGGIKADTSAQVELAADRLRVNQATGEAVFSGNVAISQGAMRLAASEVKVIYASADRRRIDRLTASGGVTLVNGNDAAEAQNAVYDVARGVITLSGDVLLTQGPNILTGDKMEVDLATGTASVDGRVRSVIDPQTR